jgi:hypothetical protein
LSSLLYDWYQVCCVPAYTVCACLRIRVEAMPYGYCTATQLLCKGHESFGRGSSKILRKALCQSAQHTHKCIKHVPQQRQVACSSTYLYLCVCTDRLSFFTRMRICDAEIIQMPKLTLLTPSETTPVIQHTYRCDTAVAEVALNLHERRYQQQLKPVSPSSSHRGCPLPR